MWMLASTTKVLMDHRTPWSLFAAHAILAVLGNERKIDIIDRRLDDVVRLLEELKTDRQPSATSESTKEQSASTRAPSSASTPPIHAIKTESDDPVIEGDSSLTAQTLLANEFLEQVVNTEQLQGASLELRETLDSLRHIMSTLRQHNSSGSASYDNASPVPGPTRPTGELPPIEKVVKMLRVAKGEKLAGIFWLEPYVAFARFPELCLTVYFSDQYSYTDYILVTSALATLFCDSALNLSPELKEENLRYCHMCRANLETALASLPLHLPATQQVIIALMSGAFYAIEICKAPLAWTLTCKASEICQTLGYQRESSMKDDKPEDRDYKHLIFWSIYFLDKGLSLRLGRASTIPDQEITVPPPDGDPSTDPMFGYFAVWTMVARCQGNIYDMLYSPNSIAQPDHVRQSRVDSLACQLDEIRIKSEKMNNSQVVADKMGSDMAIFSMHTDDVLRLSLLTLVYRAAPREESCSTTFSSNCIKAARATLQRHQECIAFMEKSSPIYFATYLHWTLLFAPFTPFIVLFCCVIETQDQEDLARLQAFVTSISLASSFSDAGSKMHRLFQVLYSVALRYVEFRIATPPQEQLQASAEIDAYLAQLGFSQAAAGQQEAFIQPVLFETHPASTEFADTGMSDGSGVVRATNPMMWMGNTEQLEDWFHGNQQMLGFLQDPAFSLPTQD
ncbi:uncharacterized protein DNG_04306 [Cephalotrichum gorgonifer]|uniref:Xylanolytic transcriptional activator regulatory domain-containing protein n=1 Tax=Cephalotrichum gorgonifer TaxID=2041049 RepID=A0AAE8SUE9_9PEZI|nr:uncharacterized protein DNG_04306 [Cephalotrichum gorgonifer]